MASKSAFLISGIALLMLLAGCSESPETGDTSTGAFIGGDEGVLLGFLEGAPPSEVFDTSSDFSLSIRLENAGENDIIAENYDNAPVLRITGIDPADFGTTSSALTKTIDVELMGAKLDPQGNVIQGTIETIDFPTDGSNLQYQGEVSGNVEFKLRASLCYEYVSKAQAKLCVREDLLGTTGKEGICDPNADKNIENSGAPVHVSNFIESVMGSNKVAFVFKIKHLGQGNVYQRGLSPACDASSHANRDKVWVEINNPHLGSMTCSGLGGTGAVTTGSGNTQIQGYTTLYGGERSIRCTLELDDPQDLEKVVEIRLKYAYEDYADTTVTVKHAT